MDAEKISTRKLALDLQTLCKQALALLRPQTRLLTMSWSQLQQPLVLSIRAASRLRLPMCNSS
jgi:hypothetical protein